MTDDDYEEDTMKNKKFIALLAMTVALSGVMTACSFGGGKEDSVVVESTPTPTPAKKAKVTPTVAADAQPENAFSPMSKTEDGTENEPSDAQFANA